MVQADQANSTNEGLRLIDAFIERLGPLGPGQEALVVAAAVNKAKPIILLLLLDLERQGATLDELLRVETKLADAIETIVRRRFAIASRNRTHH